MVHLKATPEYYIYSNSQGYLVKTSSHTLGFNNVHDPNDGKIKSFTKDEVKQSQVYPYWKKHFSDCSIVVSTKTFKTVDFEDL